MFDTTSTTDGTHNDGSFLQLPQDDVGVNAADSLATQPISSTRMAIDCTLNYQVDAASEFVFLIHATAGMSQTVVEETLLLEPATRFRTYTDQRSGNRFLRLQAEAGTLKVSYRALVDLAIAPRDVNVSEVEVHDIPDNVLRFLMPTRYCESDHLGATAQQLFGQLPRGFSRVQAIADWVRNNIEYRIGSTNATTTARDVFAQHAGVCRDFAHLSITFCRALNIPARLVCGYCPFPEPPPDFHAIFEAYLGGQWVRFDPTGMAPVEHVVRVAAGRDAKDVAFATIYGPARMTSMSPEIAVVSESASTTVLMDANSVHGQNGNTT